MDYWFECNYIGEWGGGALIPMQLLRFTEQV